MVVAETEKNLLEKYLGVKAERTYRPGKGERRL